MRPWLCCAHWMHGRFIALALMLAPPVACVAVPASEPVVPIPGMRAARVVVPVASGPRIAIATTALHDSVVEVEQVVTFTTDDRVASICLVVHRADGSRLYLPFVDSLLQRPQLAAPVPCRAA